jgi:2-phospho-L-lactate guanylyltransferase
MWAVVPVKEFAGAKQRLSGVLSPAQRAALYAEMLDHVLATLADARGLDGIAVITNETRAARYGVRVIPDLECRGQSAAVAQGARVLAAEGVRGILTIPGDVPLATAAEIERVLTEHGDVPRAMTIVPSHDGKGTNALAVSPPDLIPFHFGDASFEPHCAEARALGLEPRILRLPGLGLDIDTPDDLALLRAVAPV